MMKKRLGSIRARDIDPLEEDGPKFQNPHARACQIIMHLINKFPQYIRDISDFQYDKQIGKGAFGEVWLANDLRTGKIVAIKELYAESLFGRHLASFVREITTMVDLQIPFIVPFVGYTIEPPYSIITEYMPNGSLFYYINRSKRQFQLSGTHLSIIALCTAAAMQMISDKKILHRDLKSANIFLDSKRLPVIADFGVSRFCEPKTRKFTPRCGTYTHMAPEVMLGEDYDNLCDVYSFGMILFEMVEGRNPFGRMTGPELIKQVPNNNLRPTFHNQNLPKALLDLINKCWHPNPKERPTFMDIFHDFRKGKVYFPECDTKELTDFGDIIFKRMKDYADYHAPGPKISVDYQAILNRFQLKIDKILEAEEDKYEEPPENGRGDDDSQLASSVLTADSMDSETSLDPNIERELGKKAEDILSDPNDPKFEKALDILADTIIFAQFKTFYSALIPYFHAIGEQTDKNDNSNTNNKNLNKSDTKDKNTNKTKKRDRNSKKKNKSSNKSVKKDKNDKNSGKSDNNNNDNKSDNNDKNDNKSDNNDKNLNKSDNNDKNLNKSDNNDKNPSKSDNNVNNDNKSDKNYNADHTLKLILDAFLKVGLRDPEFFTYLVHQHFGTVLPLSSSELRMSTFNFVAGIFAYRPNILGGEMKRPLASFILHIPNSAISLFALYASKYSSLDSPYPILDLLIAYARAFLDTEAGSMLIDILFHLVSTYSEFKRQRIQKVRPVFCAFCQSKVASTAIAATKAIANLYDDAYRIHFDVICQNLNQKKKKDKDLLANATMSLLLRVNKYPVSRTLGRVLVERSITDKTAFSVLLKYASQEEDTAKIVVSNPKWMTIYSLESIKLFMICFGFQSARQIIIQRSASTTQTTTIIGEFFAGIAKDADRDILIAIPSLLKRMTPSPEMIQNLANTLFFRNYNESVANCEDMMVKNASNTMLDQFARIAYTSEYRVFLPSLIQMLKLRNELTTGAIVVLTTLSNYPEMAKVFKNSQLRAYFQSLRTVPALKQKTEIFLNNINKVE